MERVQLRSIMTDMFFFFIEFYLILARIRKQIKKICFLLNFFLLLNNQLPFFRCSKYLFSLLFIQQRVCYRNDMERKFGQVRIWRKWIIRILVWSRNWWLQYSCVLSALSVQCLMRVCTCVSCSWIVLTDKKQVASASHAEVSVHKLKWF